MLLADHQTWSSSAVLWRVTVVALVAWILYGTIVWLVARRGLGGQGRLAAVGAGLTLAAATLVAFAPINRSGGYRHCGTALVPEPKHSCAAADYLSYRVGVVGFVTVTAALLVVARRLTSRAVI